MKILKRPQLPDRRVLRVVAGDVEVAGLGAMPAADARLEIRRVAAGQVARERLHRPLDALRIGHIALLVVAHLGLRHAVAGKIELAPVHSAAPFRAKSTPVRQRETKTSAAWASLPNGSQTSSSSRLSKWTATRPGPAGPGSSAMPVSRGSSVTNQLK